MQGGLLCWMSLRGMNRGRVEVGDRGVGRCSPNEKKAPNGAREPLRKADSLADRAPVGATLVVARVGQPGAVQHTKTGDHKGRPYGDSGTRTCAEAP